VRGLMGALDDAPLTQVLSVCAEIDGVVDAVRNRRLGFAMEAAEAAGQDPLKVGKSAAALGGRCSRRNAELMAKRSRAVAANSELASALDSGALTPGHLDNIAHAMDTDVAAATDKQLIAQVSERSVDQGRRLANDWITEKTSAKDLESKHQRQRHNRTARTYWSADREAMALTLYGDAPTIDQLWRRINAQERIEYQNDGGRDVPVLDHPRTRDQRRFDAAVALLTGAATPSSGRAAAVISIPWSKVSGETPDASCEQIGFGPIPDSVALDVLMRADLFVNLTGFKGQTLWWGRSRRSADRNQFIALVLRDKGCVLCGSEWQTAESHHLLPWEAPGRGRTNVDELALVCSGCHHRLHDNHLTLYRDPANGQWLTRPATPNEIAPRRRRTRVSEKRPAGSTREQPAAKNRVSNPSQRNAAITDDKRRSNGERRPNDERRRAPDRSRATRDAA